jgi:hypothetical protein
MIFASAGTATGTGINTTCIAYFNDLLLLFISDAISVEFHDSISL